MPVTQYIPQYFEPIEHTRAEEARQKGMTVEKLLELERKNQQSPGVVIEDKRDAYQNMRASVKNNSQELQRQKEGEAKAKENAAKAVNLLLAPTLPSTYVGLAAGAMDIGTGEAKNTIGGQLWNDTRLVQDIAIPGIVLGGLPRQIISKGVTKRTPHEYIDLFQSGPIRTYGKVKYYGPTMGKTTASNSTLIDFDDVVRPKIEQLAKSKGVSPKDLKIVSDPDYVQLINDEVINWKLNPASEGKTLMISNKALSNPSKIQFVYDNTPSIPSRDVFIRRQTMRGAGTEAEAADYYDALLKENPNLQLDNRFVYQIENGPVQPSVSKLTEAERLGIPKSQRNSVSRHLNKYAQEYDNIIRSGEITPEKYSTLQYLVDQYYKHSAEFPIMSTEYSYYPRVFKHGSNSKFTVFDKSKFGSTDGGYHGEAFYTSPTDFRIKNPKESIHGERAIFSMGSRPYQYSLYLRNPKPYTITSNHGEGFSWFNRYPDGAIITNNGNGYFHGKHFTETLFTNPRQAKLANAITYDNAGNIIPLRNRFNWNNPDMRYKSGGKINYLKFFKK